MTRAEYTREDALALIREYTESESIIKHMLSVEAAMRAYACHFNEDEELWGLTGLVHDFDYEKWPNHEGGPDGHPFTGAKILRERGWPGELVQAVLAHGDYTGEPRETRLAKTLFAVDELCGFIMAVAYVRPDKLRGMKPKSVKKKLKDKRFAEAVSREDIQRGIEDLGVDENEHIARIIEAMQSIEDDLGFGADQGNA